MNETLNERLRGLSKSEPAPPLTARGRLSSLLTTEKKSESAIDRLRTLSAKTPPVSTLAEKPLPEGITRMLKLPTPVIGLGTGIAGIEPKLELMWSAPEPEPTIETVKLPPTDQKVSSFEVARATPTIPFKLKPERKLEIRAKKPGEITTTIPEEDLYLNQVAHLKRLEIDIDEELKKFGYTDPKTRQKLNTLAGYVPMAMMAIQAPIVMAGYFALDQIRSIIVSELKDEKYSLLERRVLSELLPPKTPPTVRTIAAAGEWIGSVALMTVGSQYAKEGLLTGAVKNIITNARKTGAIPEDVKKVNINLDTLKKFAKGTKLEDAAKAYIKSLKIRIKARKPQPVEPTALGFKPEGAAAPKSIYELLGKPEVPEIPRFKNINDLNKYYSLEASKVVSKFGNNPEVKNSMLADLELQRDKDVEDLAKMEPEPTKPPGVVRVEPEVIKPEAIKPVAEVKPVVEGLAPESLGKVIERVETDLNTIKAQVGIGAIKPPEVAEVEAEGIKPPEVAIEPQEVPIAEAVEGKVGAVEPPKVEAKPEPVKQPEITELVEVTEKEGRIKTIEGEIGELVNGFRGDFQSFGRSEKYAEYLKLQDELTELRAKPTPIESKETLNYNLLPDTVPKKLKQIVDFMGKTHKSFKEKPEMTIAGGRLHYEYDGKIYLEKSLLSDQIDTETLKEGMTISFAKGVETGVIFNPTKREQDNVLSGIMKTISKKEGMQGRATINGINIDKENITITDGAVMYIFKHKGYLPEGETRQFIPTEALKTKQMISDTVNEYPNYEMVIPKDEKIKEIGYINVPEALSQIRKVIPEGEKELVPVSFFINKKSKAQFGTKDSMAYIDKKYVNKAFETLDKLGVENVEIKFSKNNPLLITTGKNARIVVMPIRDKVGDDLIRLNAEMPLEVDETDPVSKTINDEIIFDKNRIIKKGGVQKMPVVAEAEIPEGKAGEIPKGEIVKRSQIIKDLSESLEVPVRIGKFRQKAAGIYKPKEGIIRTKQAQDISVTAHEVGHHLEKIPEIKTLMGEDETGNRIQAEELLKLTQTFPIADRTPSEGFAEFIKDYITSSERLAGTKIENAFRDFLEKNEDVAEILNRAKSDYIRWKDMPSTAKVLSQISTEPQKTPRLTPSQIYTKVIDEYHPLKKYVDIIKKKGIQVLEKDDPYIIARLHKGYTGKADSFLRYGTLDKNLNVVGKPLSEILRTIKEGKNADDLRVYLVSKRAIEILDSGKKTGIGRVDAVMSINELDKKYPEFKQIANDLYEYQDTLLKYALDWEGVDKELYNKIKKANKLYVPFHRVMEEVTASGQMGKGSVNLPSGIKRLKGSEREIIDPIETIVKNSYVFVDLGERKEIVRATVRLAGKHPEDLGKLVEHIARPIAKIGEVSGSEIKNYLENQGMALTEEEFEGVMNIFRPSYFNPERNTIRVDGKDYQVDPDLYRSLADEDSESMGFLIKLMSYPARWLRLGATGLSPEFALRNPLRDAIAAYIQSEAGFIPGIDSLRGLFSILKQDELYWKWKISGAEHSMMVSLDRDYLQQEARQVLATKMGKLSNVIRHPIETARIFSELSEAATRIGEFRLLMNKRRALALLSEKLPEDYDEKSRLMRAGLGAREVTLDFQRIGAKVKAVNRLVAFWNANNQGLDKMARTFKKHPMRTLYKVLMGLTIPSLYLWYVNHDDDRYKEIPQWQKDNFWIVLTPRDIWRLPKPFTYGMVFGTMAERAMDYMLENNKEAFKDFDKSLGQGLLPGFLPTAFQTPLEIATNYDLFRNRSIINPNDLKLPAGMQFSEYNKQFSKAIGQKLDISPLKIEHLIYGWTGGGGKLALETFDAILRTTNILPSEEKPPATLADTPVVRGFVVREPKGSASESLRVFYEERDRIKGYEAGYNRLLDNEEVKEAKEFAKKYPEYLNAGQYDYMSRTISSFRKHRELVARAGNYKGADGIEREMTKIVSKFNKDMRKLK